MVQAGEGEHLAQAAALRGRVDCRRRTPRRGRRRAAWSSGSRAARRRPSATSRPAGSNHASAIRAARLSASIAPCSGWSANAAALTRTTSSRVRVAVAADRHARRARRARAAASRSAGASPTARAPARSPCRPASRAAAGWSPCDHAVTGPSPVERRGGQLAAQAAAARRRARRPGRPAPACASAKPSPPASHSVLSARPWCLSAQPGRLVERVAARRRRGSAGADAGSTTSRHESSARPSTLVTIARQPRDVP